MPALNTTQFIWTKNKMPNKARPTGTIFQPEVAARAILFGAENDRREIMVGYTTVEATLARKSSLAYSIVTWRWRLGRARCCRSRPIRNSQQLLGAGPARPWVSRTVRSHGARLQLAALGLRKSRHAARWVVTGRYWAVGLDDFQPPQPTTVWIFQIEAAAVVADVNLTKAYFK